MKKYPNKKRKPSTTNSCNFEYGLLSPTTNAEQVDALILLGHRYKNKLCEISLDHRTKYRAMARSGDLDALEVSISVLVGKRREEEEKIKVIKAKTRKRSTPEMEPFKAQVKALREQLRVLREQRKTIKATIKEDPAVVKAAEALNEGLIKEIKKARAASGLSGCWGTYVVLERAAAAARHGKMDPRFHRWGGAGFIAVQLQGGLGPSETASDTRFQIDPVDADAYDAPKRGDRRRKARTVVRLRIGSDEKRRPIWADFPAIIHRPLPADCNIKEVRVMKRRIGVRYKWTLLVTIARSKEAPPMRKGHSGNGRVGIDIGWRLRDDGSLRVAYWQDDQGGSGEYTLDPSYRKAHDRVESLRSIRDKNLDVMRPVLAALIKEVKIPEWFTERGNITLWRSPARFAALALFWRDQRFAGDEKAYDLINKWRHQDKHLLDWESSLREKIYNRRRDRYRCFAAKIADKYDTVVMENFDLRQVAVLGGENELHATARYQRQIAAVSKLRGAIKNACSMRGVVYLEVPAAYTTRVCHACGSVEKWDQRELVHTCGGCGVTWDQDANAADNILRAA